MSTLETIVNRLGPKLFGAILLGVVGFVGLTVAYAMLTGRSVDLWGLKIEQPPAHVTDQRAASSADDCPPELSRAEAEVADLRRERDQALTRADLADLWPAERSKADMLAALRAKPDAPECGADDTTECIYAKILNRIGESGGAIDLLQAPQPTVVLIQKALNGVGFYDREFDGNAAMTKRSLIAFQKQYRIRTNDNTIEGLMGRKTLDKIRSVRQLIVDGT